MEIIIISILLIISINVFVYFSADKKTHAMSQLITSLLSIAIFVGLYFAAKEWLSFRYDLWSNLGVIYGIILLFWISLKEIEKKTLSLYELVFLFLMPILFYLLYGMNLSLSILIGLISVILGYTITSLLKARVIKE